MDTVIVTAVEELATVEVDDAAVKITIDSVAPANPANGDLWVDTSM